MKSAIALSAIVLVVVTHPAASHAQSTIPHREIDSLRAAIEDLRTSFGPRYPKADDYLKQLDAVVQSFSRGAATAGEQFSRLRQEALLANPLLEDLQLLVVKRKPQLPGRGWQPPPGLGIGMPSNHECNTSLNRQGFDNEIAILQSVRPEGRLSTLYRPPHRGYVGELDLHEDGKRFLFTQSDAENWKVWELDVDGRGLRQVSQAPADVDCFDACYLPDGRIVLGSTASFQAVPCWHGLRRVSNLYRMNADGTGMRQLCFDQDHDLHPTVVANGQVMYSRWDYTGINHIFLRELMVMNPDGTGQRALYGSNSWFPNSLYFPRVLPGEPNQFVCILSGYHGPHRMGQLVLVDTRPGMARGGRARAADLRSGRSDPAADSRQLDRGRLAEVPPSLSAQRQALPGRRLDGSAIAVADLPGRCVRQPRAGARGAGLCPAGTGADPRDAGGPQDSRSRRPDAGRRRGLPARRVHRARAGRSAAGDRQELAGHGLPFRLSRLGRARPDRLRRPLGGDANSGDGAPGGRWFRQFSRAGQHAACLPGARCPGSGGAADAKLGDGHAGREAFLRRLPRDASRHGPGCVWRPPRCGRPATSCPGTDRPAGSISSGRSSRCWIATVSRATTGSAAAAPICADPTRCPITAAEN